MVKINKDACIGCGSCVGLTNEVVFDIGDDGLAYVKDGFDYEEEKENIENAIDGCPTSAIVEE